MTLVVAEQHEGRLNPVSFEAVVAAQQLGDPVTIVLLGSGISGAAGGLAKADVHGVVALEHDALAHYTPDGHVAALTAFVRTLDPARIVFVHTYRTRDYAPRLAARLGLPLATDCTAVRRDRGQCS